MYKIILITFISIFIAISYVSKDMGEKIGTEVEARNSAVQQALSSK